MKSVMKIAVALVAVGLLVGGPAGVALADHNRPGLAETGHPGEVPGYYAPLDTTQPGWIHMQGGAYVGYPPDYSNTPNSQGWIPMGAPESSLSTPPQTAQAQPPVAVAPFLGNDMRSSHNG